MTTSIKKDIDEVNLSNNKLTQLPVEIGQLTQLTTLNLSYNQLTQLSVEIGQLTQLITFDLSYNQLTQLSVEIGQLTQLTTTKIYDQNQLTTQGYNYLPDTSSPDSHGVDAAPPLKSLQRVPGHGQSEERLRFA